MSDRPSHKATDAMKAWKLSAYGNFDKGIQLLEVPIPIIDEDEVLIECHAASLNPVDYKFAEGQLKMFYKQQMPAGLGFDCSGIVAAIGKNVNHLKVGDEVFCCVPTSTPGTIAEYVAVKAEVVLQKPKNLTFVEAASTPLVGLTIISCMQAIDLSAGQKILIHAGSGGVGSFAIQYAKQLGAEVYTTTGTSNVSWVKQLGAYKVIDYKTHDYKVEVPKLDAVFDTLGDQYTLDAFKLLKPGGKVVSIAGRRLDDKASKKYGLNIILRGLMKLMLLPISIRCKKYNASYRFILNEPTGERLHLLKEQLESGAVKPVIHKVYDFSEVVDAFKMQQSGRAKGKLVITIKSTK